MIYFTGDTHGENHIKKLTTAFFPEQKTLTREDSIFIAGDFGLIWHKDKTEIFLKKWFSNKKPTFYFVRGNHENYERLNSDEFPTVKKLGNYVKQIEENIFMLNHGHIYEVEGKTLIALEGASSTDEGTRRNRITWWEEEVPSYSKMMEAIESIRLADNKVDIILSHAVHSYMLASFNFKDVELGRKRDPVSRFLEEVRNMTEYKYWICGHYHKDVYDIYSRTHCLFNSILSYDQLGTSAMPRSPYLRY